MKNKKTYQAPKLIVHGDASQLTLLTKKGAKLDKTFATDTPLSQLTVS